MSIASEIERLKNAKTSIKTAISNKGISVPDTAKLDVYNTYIEQIETGGGSSTEILEQLPNPVTNVKAEPNDDTSMKITWTNPNDEIEGIDIAVGENGLPTFPLNSIELYGTIGNTTTLTIGGLTKGTRYGFLVMPRGTNGLRQTCVTTDNNTLAILMNSGVYVMVDKTGKVYHCLNGANWVYKAQIPNITVNNTHSICYGDGKIVVTGHDSDGNVVVYYSTDGTTWTQGTLNVAYNSTKDKCVAYGNNVFVLTVFNAVYYSTNGINWTQTYTDSTGMSYGHRSLCYGNGVFVALSRDRAVALRSTDGINWSREWAWNSSADRPYDIKFVNDRFVAVGGYNGEANSHYSFDGLTWEVMTITLNSVLQKVCGGNGIYLAWVNTTCVRSTNGTSWEEGTITLPYAFDEIYFAKGLFIGLAFDGAFTSTDGITWTAMNGYVTETGAYAVCYADI